MIFKPDSPHVDAIRPAVNVERRKSGFKPELLIMHYTGMSSAAKAIDWLSRAESKVSCHYVIDEEGIVTQMVPEKLRAWHAGQSYWHGETDINSKSIGIEIQNPGHENGYPRFRKRQMQAVAQLSHDIVFRHHMRPECVLAHSDIAPQRKIDPGEKFNWEWLAGEGVGFWVTPATSRSARNVLGIGAKNADVEGAQELLARYGYDVRVTGELDLHTWKVLRAFQLHFRQKKPDGLLDRSTCETLEALVEKVRRLRSRPNKHTRKPPPHSS